MKYRLVPALAALALMSTVTAAAPAKFVVGEAQIGWVDTLQPPQVSCAGGEPTGLPFPPCSEGTGRILVKDEVQQWAPASLSDSVRSWLMGTITFEINCTLNEAYRGPCWGKFEWDVPGVGTWQGSWTAPVMDLITFESKVSMVGFGAGGDIEGKQLRFDGRSAPYDSYITGRVRIH